MFFLSNRVRPGLRAGWLLTVLALFASMDGRGATQAAAAESDGAVRLAAREARLSGLRKEVEVQKDSHSRKVRTLKETFEKEEAELRQAVEDSRAEAEALLSRIQELERNNLAMSNETVTVIGRLPAQLRGGRRAASRPGAAGAVVDKSCTQCQGSGRVPRQETCKVCRGAGSFSKTSSILRRTGTRSTSTVNERCSHCKGAGRITVRDTCTGCNGSGRVPLSR